MGILIIGQANAATLTQKLGSEYITTTVEAGRTVNMEFTSKIGYQFKNWTVEAGGVSIDTTDPSVSFEMPSNNVTIRGNYDATYKVTFNSNGGTGSISSMTVAAGGSDTLPTNTITKSGYTFKGWAETADGEVKYEDEESITPTENITLYAIWESATAGIIPIEDIPVGAYIKYAPASKTVTVLGTDTGTGSNQTFNTSSYTSGWKVMYNNAGQLDIVSAESVVDGLIIGTDVGVTNDTAEVDKMRTGFAKAPYTLNKMCSEYATGEFAVSGRSLGSAGGGASNLIGQTVDGHQITIDDVSHSGLRALVDSGKVTVDADGLVSYPYTSISDMDVASAEMGLISSTPSLLHTADVNEAVWLACRDVDSNSDNSYFNVGVLFSVGSIGYCDFGGYSDGNVICFSLPCGVRPVVSLESGLKVVSGDGLTAETAYVLSR